MAKRRRSSHIGGDAADYVRRRVAKDPELAAGVQAELAKLQLARQVKILREAKHLTKPTSRRRSEPSSPPSRGSKADVACHASNSSSESPTPWALRSGDSLPRIAAAERHRADGQSASDRHRHLRVDPPARLRCPALLHQLEQEDRAIRRAQRKS